MWSMESMTPRSRASLAASAACASLASCTSSIQPYHFSTAPAASRRGCARARIQR